MGFLVEFCFERLVEIINHCPARKWAVILTGCKWVVVNSIRIQKWVVHYYELQMGCMFSTTDVMLTCGPTIFLRIIVSDAYGRLVGLLRRTEGFVNL